MNYYSKKHESDFKKALERIDRDNFKLISAVYLFTADMMYYYLIECGTDMEDGMSGEEFRKLIQKQYDEVMDGVY